MKPKKRKNVKVRKQWGPLKPATRVIPSKKVYKRTRLKSQLKKDLSGD